MSDELKAALKRYEAIPQFSGSDLVSVHQKGFDADTPLHVAVRRGAEEDTILFLEHGADANALGDLGNTPLHEAAAAGHSLVVEILVKHGGDPAIQNEFGQTPADLAHLKNFAEIVESLKNVQASWQLP